jgi:hypothetical protein
MTEDINNPSLSDINQFSGGVLNPLAKEQAGLELPPLPVAPSVNFPHSTGLPTNLGPDPGKALAEYLANPQAYAIDKFAQGKEMAYDASYTGANFDRYYRTPNVFKKAGFSPWKDNESIYNSQMSWWDAYKRSAGAMTNLFSSAFKAALPWNAWSDVDTGVDKESAEEMEKWHAIGHDSRGGAGAFMNNLTLDSGYTFGIMAELAAEEIVLWGAGALLAPETAGTSLGLAGAESAAAVARAATLMDRMKNLGVAGRAINKSWEGFKALKDVNNVRNIYNSVKSGKPISHIMDILTPGTATFVKDAYKASKSGENIYTLTKAARGVGALYRDIREIGTAISESKVEGGTQELNLKKQLTDSFYRENGRMPDANEYGEIYRIAKDAAHETFLWNMPALWLSNKLVFDKAFRGLKPMRAFRQELSEGIAGKLVFDKTAVAGKESWSVAKTGIKSLGDPLTWKPKNLLRNITGGLFKYTKANFAEGLQESYQEGLSKTMADYYTARYKHPGSVGVHDVWAMFGDRMKEQFTTKEGLEVFASGFLMGGIVQLPQHLMYDKAPKMFNKMTDPEGYAKGEVAKEQRTNDVVNALNEVTKNADKFFNPHTQNTVSQGIANDALANSRDTKTSIDIQDESVFEHLHTLLKTGKLDLIKDYLSDMKTLSGEELEQAYGKLEEKDGDPKEYYTRKIDNMLNRADEIQRRYDHVNDKYGNPFDPYRYSPGKDLDKYNQEVYKYQAWEEAKKIAVFSAHSFDRSLERMSSIMKDVTTNKPIAKAMASDFSILFTPMEIDTELKVLKQEATAMQETPGAKRDGKKVQKKYDALKEYKESVDEYQTALKSKDDTEEKIGEALKGMEKAYKNYLKVIAEQNDDYIFNNKVDESFEKVKDFYAIKADSKNLADVINMLENPEMFEMYAQRFKNIAESLHLNRLDLFKEAMNRKAYIEAFNELINKIFALGAYFDASDMEAFSKGSIPSKFYDVTSGTPLSPNSKKYRDIIDLIEEFERNNQDQKPFDKPILDAKEPDLDPENNNYHPDQRYKINEDKRTYREHAKFWGFAEDAVETKVSTQEVLDKIIDGKYSTYREKALARRLKTYYKDSDTITFKKGHGTPGVFEYYTDGKEFSKLGVIIDARYNSSDYMGGRAPIEPVILHELLHELTSVEMKKDAEFKSKISNLLKVATDHFTTPEIREQYNEHGRFYGLKNEDEFIAEAMSNDNFRAFLKTIPFEVTGKSAWEEFVDTLRRFFSRIFGLKQDSTVLDEAIHLITKKIDAEHGSSEETETPGPAVSGGVAISVTTPIAQMPADLVTKLIESYKEWSKDKYEQSEEIPDPQVFEKTDEEIKKTVQFKNLVKSLPRMGKIIREYNKATNRTAPVDQNTTETKEDNKTKIITQKMKEHLMDLGYSKEEILKMNVIEAENIIQSGKKKGQDEVDKQKAALAQEREMQKRREDTITNLTSMLEKIDSVKALDEFYDALLEQIRDTDIMKTSGINTDVIHFLVDAKRRDLMKKVTFDDLVVNETVMMKNKKEGLMVVVEKLDNSVKLRKFGDPAAPVIEIKKNHVESTIAYKEKPGLESKDVAPTKMTKEDIKTSNEDVKNAQNINNTESIAEDIARAKKMSNEDLANDLLNNLGC